VLLPLLTALLLLLRPASLELPLLLEPLLPQLLGPGLVLAT
jgi:hypothetical protein